MTTAYAALLRGINVGGKRKVPMAELRTLLTGLGFGDVRTYLQSGNVVFTDTSADDEDVLATRLRDAMEERFGFVVDTIVRGHAYLQGVVDACPFPAAELEGRQLHAIYYSTAMDPSRFESLDPTQFLPEEYRLGDRVLYLYAPNGLADSKLAVTLSARTPKSGVVATSRNWNTVVKLAEMTRVG